MEKKSEGNETAAKTESPAAASSSRPPKPSHHSFRWLAAMELTLPKHCSTAAPNPVPWVRLTTKIYSCSINWFSPISHRSKKPSFALETMLAWFCCFSGRRLSCPPWKMWLRTCRLCSGVSGRDKHGGIMCRQSAAVIVHALSTANQLHFSLCSRLHYHWTRGSWEEWFSIACSASISFPWLLWPDVPLQ